MGSELFSVEVTSKRKDTIALRVRSVHPDAVDIPADKSFALMMLREAAGEGSLLAAAFGIHDSIDAEWMAKHASTYVSAVAVGDRRTEPHVEASLKITVTDRAWIAHLAKGSRWESRAFVVASSHGPPAAPTANAATKGDDGFVSVPREVWLRYRVPSSAPAFVDVPAYGEASYLVKQAVAGPHDASTFRAFHGRAVQTSANSRDRGVLLLDGKIAYLAKLEAGGSSLAMLGESWSAPIGLLELKPKGQRGTRLAYSMVLASLVPEAIAAERVGASAEIVIRVPPSRGSHFVQSASDVLRVLASPLLDAFGWSFVRPAALADALTEDRRARDCSDFDELYPLVALGYVSSFSIDPAPPAETPALDGMQAAEVRAYFEKPWPRVKLRVEATDARWLEHLDAFTPFPVVDSPLPAPLAWTGEPRRAPT